MATPPVPWTSAQALAWLRREGYRGTHNYKGLCAGLAADASGYTYAGNNANAWGWTIPKSIRRTGTAPAGALCFWTGGQYGHVAYSLGGGVLLCNKPDGSVGKMYASYYAGIGPTFWVDTSKNKAAIFGHCGGRNTDPAVVTVAKPPVVAPKPGLPQVHLANVVRATRAGSTAPAISKIKAALRAEGIAISSTTDQAGAGFKAAYKKWQQKLGYKGADADGIPGKASLTKLGKKHGFEVV
jgi:putative hemolysin